MTFPNPLSIPDNLRSTAVLIARAFPKVIGEADYLPLLCVLAEHLSVRNLATIAEWIKGMAPGDGYNDALRASALCATTDKTRVSNLLEQAGMAEWEVEE
jgi:hypothetical protein